VNHYSKNAAKLSEPIMRPTNILLTALLLFALPAPADTVLQGNVERDDATLDARQQIGGIGVIEGDDIQGSMVIKVENNSPASLNDVRVGDIVRAVNGESMAGRDALYVCSRVLGQLGTSVIITYQRNTSYMTKQFVRKPLNEFVESQDCVTYQTSLNYLSRQ
jgi:S1-C subfamily serine protease